MITEQLMTVDNLSHQDRQIIIAKIQELHRAITQKVLSRAHALCCDGNYVSREFPDLKITEWSSMYVDTIIQLADDMIKGL